MSSSADYIIPAVNVEALKSEIRMALVSDKAFACPIAVRLAWHASGTFDLPSGTGGSDGATMRFAPERDDPGNAGLGIVRDLLWPVKERHPGLSQADLWTFAGVVAVELMGGPRVPFRFGRRDDADAARCPAHGRLPDGAQGAEHVRGVFRRMGFDDREIVALSGAHSVGSCHRSRSGFEGPWTHSPLRFDNAYFRNLLNLTWVPRQWDGPLQYADTATGRLMMLPSDMALVQDPAFRHYVELYAADQQLFFNDFANAYGKLLALGCPKHCDPFQPSSSSSSSTSSSNSNAIASQEFRDFAMHGAEEALRKAAAAADVHAADPATGRTALHYAAFWGHEGIIRYLACELRLDANARDASGESPLHDAARFGHLAVAKTLLSAGADPSLVSKEGYTPLGLASRYHKDELVDLLRSHSGAGKL